MRRVNALEVLRHFVKSFVPSDALPTVMGAADGVLEPVLIVVKILQCNGLRADVSSAQRVVFVTADIQTLVGLNSDFDATYRFAEIAGAIMNGAIVGGCHGALLGVVHVAILESLDSLASPLGLGEWLRILAVQKRGSVGSTVDVTQRSGTQSVPSRSSVGSTVALSDVHSRPDATA